MNIDWQTRSSVEVDNTNKYVTAILQYPSIILTSSDIALATRRISPISRRKVIDKMIEKDLLREDNYLARQLAHKVKLVKGYAKRLPRKNDETERYDFIKTLSEFDITWNNFMSYFDLNRDPRSNNTVHIRNGTRTVEWMQYYGLYSHGNNVLCGPNVSVYGSQFTVQQVESRIL